MTEEKKTEEMPVKGSYAIDSLDKDVSAIEQARRG